MDANLKECFTKEEIELIATLNMGQIEETELKLSS